MHHMYMVGGRLLSSVLYMFPGYYCWKQKDNGEECAVNRTKLVAKSRDVTQEKSG